MQRRNLSDHSSHATYQSIPGMLTGCLRGLYRRLGVRLYLLVLLAFFNASCADRVPILLPAEPEPTVIVLETYPAGSCGLELPPDANDSTQIRAVVETEGHLVVERELSPLMALWAEESRIVNTKNTPDDPADNQIWSGKDAIRHRYLNLVFPSAPDATNPISLAIIIDGDSARAIGVTQIGSEMSPGDDLWELARIDGCWQIISLTYNLEPIDASP